VVSVDIRPHLAAVTLTGPLPLPEQRRGLERIPAPPVWRPEDVFALAARFRQGMPIHSATGATHSCFLMRGGEIVYECEDLSRHNAVDKAVGFAVVSGTPLGECLLYTSGRLPEEQVRRAAAAGIGVLVSKATPTAQAVELARALGVVLLCRAWEDRFERFA
jgi:FdhD protein